MALDESEREELDESEREELERLRAERSVKTEDKPVKEEPLPDTHWLHLADGRVITSKGTMTHYEGIPVIRADEIPVEPVTVEHRF